MTRFAVLAKILVLTVFAVSLDGRTVSAQSAAAAQVCAEIMADYGIAPEGCDPEADARRAATEPQKTSARATAKADPAGSLAKLEPEMIDSNIFFAAGGAKLDATAIERLDLLAAVLAPDVVGRACLQLVGHSDSSGPAEPNRAISLKRANAVANYLRPLLDDPSRIEAVVAVGEDEPLPGIAADDPINRRVTILARDCPEP